MKIFDDKVYSLDLSYNESTVMLGFLTVKSYDRLYDKYRQYNENIKTEDKEMMGAGKKLHFIESVNRLKDEDRITDAIMMNQLALGLLLEYYARFLAGIKKGESRKLKLNSILIYELYITVCERIIIETKDYSEFDDDEKSKRDKNLCALRLNELKSIADKIKECVSLKTLSLMEIEYEKISLRAHLDLCLQEF